VAVLPLPAVPDAERGCLASIVSATHSSMNGDGNRDGNSFPPANLFDGDLSTRARFRTGASPGFTLTVTFSAPRTVQGVETYVTPGMVAGYAGIRISTDSGSGFVSRFTDTGLFARTGRNGSAEVLGGVAWGANVSGLQGTVQHLLPVPVSGVTAVRLEFGWNDEDSDACYSINELRFL